MMKWLDYIQEKFGELPLVPQMGIIFFIGFLIIASFMIAAG